MDLGLKLPFQVTDRVNVPSDYFQNTYAIELRVAPDGMKADIMLVPAAGVEPGSIFLAGEDIEVFLENAGISYGLNGRTISRMAKERKFNQWVTVARGKPPVMGQDATITLLFTAESGEQDLIQNVKKGDPLCDILKATPGMPGITVYGKQIPARDGKDIALPKGENVVLSRNGSRLLADMDGMVVWDGKHVHVWPVCQVDHVDASTGDIHFQGTVVVKNVVGDGSAIHATQDIIIGKDVGAAILESGGSIKILGGVRGEQKSIIKSGGNVVLHFVQDAQVTADGAVIVADYIRDSEIKALGPVMVKSSSGVIDGGMVSSESWIYAHSVGSPINHATTRLIIGHDPVLPAKKAGNVEEIHAMVKDFSKLYASLIKLRRLKEKYPLSKQQETLYAKIFTAMGSLRSHIVKADAEIFAITKKVRKAHAGFIAIEGSIRAGTVLQIGSVIRSVQQEMGATQFSLADGELVESVFSLKPEIKKLLARDRHDKT